MGAKGWFVLILFAATVLGLMALGATLHARVTAPPELPPPEAVRLTNLGVRLTLNLCLIAVMVGLSAALIRWALIRSGVIYAQDALYPLLLRWFQTQHQAPDNQPHAQVARAAMKDIDRINAGTMKALLAPPPGEEMLEPIEHIRTLTLADATRVDPRVNPHWLMIGKTGSGKSNAMRHILATMAERWPSEFVICEPQRGNWKDAAHAWTVDGIAGAVQAVYDEMQRRAALLAANPTADHIMDVGAQLPYLCLIFAEMDATMDNLYKLDRAQHRVTLVQLRDIARMGRKDGVCLFAESQAGLADVLDSNIARNFANIFLFNGSQQTAKTFGVSDLVSLPKLLPGQAFALSHEMTVEFPIVPRPTLRRSHLYQEQGRLLAEPDEIMQLPADAESDGLGADDLPSDQPVGVPYFAEAPERATGGVFGGTVGVQTLTLEQRIAEVPRDRAPRAVDIETLYRLWEQQGRNLSAVERAVYGYDGGQAHYWAAESVNQALRRRGKPARYTGPKP